MKLVVFTYLLVGKDSEAWIFVIVDVVHEWVNVPYNDLVAVANELF